MVVSRRLQINSICFSIQIKCFQFRENSRQNSEVTFLIKFENNHFWMSENQHIQIIQYSPVKQSGQKQPKKYSYKTLGWQILPKLVLNIIKLIIKKSQIFLAIPKLFHQLSINGNFQQISILKINVAILYIHQIRLNLHLNRKKNRQVPQNQFKIDLSKQMNQNYHFLHNKQKDFENVLQFFIKRRNIKNKEQNKILYNLTNETNVNSKTLIVSLKIYIKNVKTQNKRHIIFVYFVKLQNKTKIKLKMKINQFKGPQLYHYLLTDHFFARFFIKIIKKNLGNYNIIQTNIYMTKNNVKISILSQNSKNLKLKKQLLNHSIKQQIQGIIRREVGKFLKVSYVYLQRNSKNRHFVFFLYHLEAPGHLQGKIPRYYKKQYYFTKQKFTSSVFSGVQAATFCIHCISRGLYTAAAYIQIYKKFQF
eukprot:TRINITY_DN18307_c0_g1_i4.p1 TRINITY_DN18307_c0_g1~~TRINITY_DN18307_c0_g1_i4.p1  ORF type:complete len:421 (+),score=-41.64 TRINITY_DN18307_c0_g1_i4:144-1406(+)